MASAWIVAVALQALASGSVGHATLFTHAASGFALTITVDGLSAWFLLVLGVVSVPVAVYSVGYMAHAVAAPRTAMVGIAFNVLLAAVAVVLVADTVIGFIFAWEVMSLATAALVATEHEQRCEPARRVPVPRHVARRHRLPPGRAS